MATRVDSGASYTDNAILVFKEPLTVLCVRLFKIRVGLSVRLVRLVLVGLCGPLVVIRLAFSTSRCCASF